MNIQLLGSASIAQMACNYGQFYTLNGNALALYARIIAVALIASDGCCKRALRPFTTSTDVYTTKIFFVIVHFFRCLRFMFFFFHFIL